MTSPGEVGPGAVIRLRDTWRVGALLGSGGFGRVYEAQGEERAAIKFVPKLPGADREMLFVALAGIRKVMAILDTGEHGDSWVLVMPRADGSLRDVLDATPGEALRRKIP